MAVTAQKDGVTIGRGLLYRHGSDHTVTARFVFHQHRLTQSGTEALAKKTCSDVRSTSWRSGHHDLQRSARKTSDLSLCERCQGQHANHQSFENNLFVHAFLLIFLERYESIASITQAGVNRGTAVPLSSSITRHSRWSICKDSASETPITLLIRRGPSSSSTTATV